MIIWIVNYEFFRVIVFGLVAPPRVPEIRFAPAQITFVFVNDQEGSAYQRGNCHKLVQSSLLSVKGFFCRPEISFQKIYLSDLCGYKTARFTKIAVYYSLQEPGLLRTDKELQFVYGSISNFNMKCYNRIVCASQHFLVILCWCLTRKRSIYRTNHRLSVKILIGFKFNEIALIIFGISCKCRSQKNTGCRASTKVGDMTISKQACIRALPMRTNKGVSPLTLTTLELTVCLGSVSTYLGESFHSCCTYYQFSKLRPLPLSNRPGSINIKLEMLSTKIRNRFKGFWMNEPHHPHLFPTILLPCDVLFEVLVKLAAVFLGKVIFVWKIVMQFLCACGMGAQLFGA